jgi:asparagine synthetase B (glutamine-hydrolysing)
LQTFAVGVEESDFNELPYARMVAEQYKTDHHESCVNPNLIQMLPRMIYHMDEPSDPIAACMFHAAELASKSVKVVLGGDGGDELFGGFDRYTGDQYINWYQKIPDSFPSEGDRSGAREQSRTVSHIKVRLPSCGGCINYQLINDPGERYAEATCFFGSANTKSSSFIVLPSGGESEM